MLSEASIDVVRFLLHLEPIDNSTNTTPGDDANTTTAGNETDEKKEGREIYEFAAFVCWYLFLVLCCVLPALCAYRRRRLRQRRMALVFLRSAAADGAQVTVLANHDDARRILEGHEERIKQERTIRIEEAIRITTMTVSEEDFVEKGGETSSSISVHDSHVIDSSISRAIDEEVGEYAANDLYLYDETEHVYAALRLPDRRGDVEAPNGSRTVPPACAICLCPYEANDTVTWSPKEHCKHAFHKECIVPWLAKKDESLCPCCRQEFCEVPAIAIQLHSSLRPAPTSVVVGGIEDYPAVLEASDGVGNT